MSVSIRFARHGSIHRPFYHLIACDSRKAPGKEFIEKLGVYDPGKNPSLFTINEARVQYWYSVGAQPTSAVANLLRKNNVALARIGKIAPKVVDKAEKAAKKAEAKKAGAEKPAKATKAAAKK